MKNGRHKTNSQRPLLTPKEVRRLLNYKGSCSSSFWAFVRAEGVPFIRLNARRYLFDPAAVEAWLRKRAVGRHDAPILGSETDGRAERE